MKPECPINEPQRQEALCGLGLLDTEPEARFDRITRLAQRFFGTSIALISLVDCDRQWFKSRQGLEAPETPRDVSFCGHAILTENVLVVPNALEDPRFADNPLVTGGPAIRFYSGAPLHAPGGERVGTLCIIDPQPRAFPAEAIAALRDFADCVEAEFERTELLTKAQRERHLSQVLEHTSYGVAITDAEGRLEWVNQGFKTLTGYTLAEVIGKTPGSFLQGAGTDSTTVGEMHAALQEGRAFEVEVVNYRKNGSPYWVALNVQPVRDGEGRLEKFIAIQSEITERKRAESRIRSGEQRIRAIVDNVVDGIITIDALGSIQTLNPAAERIFGYTREEVLGQNVKMLMPAPFREAHDTFLLNYMTTGERKIIGTGREVQGQRKDGTLFPIDLAVGEMEVDGQRMFTGVVRDISQRREAEARLHASTVLNQAILDSAHVSIISTDPHGLILTFNRAAERMLGYSTEEMVGLNNPGVFHDPEEVVRRAKELSLELGQPIEPGFEVFVTRARMGHPEAREWTYIRKDGVRLPVLLSVTALRDTQDEISGFLGVAVDLTERKRVEQIKSEFISTVSHELRTPLTSIRGALGLVLGKVGDTLPEKVQKMLELAARNSERLTLLINDILDLEKIEGGKLEFEFKPLDLAALGRRAVEDNEGFAEKHQVRLVLTPGLSKAFARGDEHRLLQVCANLISNAIKFSPSGGAVEVSVSPHEKGFRVGVQDHGPGIPEHFRERIFQRFAQADSSDSRKKGGTGLGLSITKAIVERHQGTVGFESEAGKGTLFYFDLPALVEQREAPQTQGPRALICEDDEDVAHVLEALLRTEGLTCDLALTAEAARRLLDRHPYRLMLLDLTLPDLDGLRFLQELRQHPATCDLPVIVVSGRALEGKQAFSGNAQSVVDWLQKPVDPQRLSRALRQALSQLQGPRVLHVEDDSDLAQFTKSLLEGIAEYQHVPSKREALERLGTETFDLVILDLNLPDGSGLELLDLLKGRCPVVIFSAFEPTPEIAQQVNAALTKSTTSNDQFLATIRQALAGKRGEG